MTNQRECFGRDEIYVRNARAAKEWYSELLDLRTAHYEPGWTMFVLAGAADARQVALIQADETAPLPQQQRVGHGRIARRLDGSDEFWSFYERIKAKGVAIDRLADRGDAFALCLCDPDGNGVEIYYRYQTCTEEGSTGDTPLHKSSPGERLGSPSARTAAPICYLFPPVRAAA
jgi:catechol-2,3-dioxygenase